MINITSVCILLPSFRLQISEGVSCRGPLGGAGVLAWSFQADSGADVRIGAVEFTVVYRFRAK